MSKNLKQDKTPSQLKGTNRHGKPPKRLTDYAKQVKLKKGLITAEFNAIEKFKNSPKGFMRSLKDHFGKAVDRVEPLELFAVVGMTFIVKSAIDKSEELRGALKVSKSYWSGSIGIKKVAAVAEAYEISKQIDGYEGMFPDWTDWLISFAIAYVLVHHAGAILGLLGDLSVGISNIVGMFLLH